ncbi:MAG: epoxyqueuosine reductase [Chloroflexi bacterium]|nr:epoxyqueuosine reductase [Chloroflexota bacterium]
MHVPDTGSLLFRLTCDLPVDLAGVADITTGKEHFNQLPEALTAKLPLAIVIGARLSPAVLESVETAPTLVYYHHYKQVNALLDRATLRIGREITRMGYLAVPIAASQIVDWEKQLGHVSHKALAGLAGLGWRGRNNLLVTEKWGAQVRLATVLTNLPLQPGKPAPRDCGDCRACVSVCPAGAIKEDVRDFDGSACYRQLRQFTKTSRIGQNICGICVRACAGSEAGG